MTRSIRLYADALLCARRRQLQSRALAPVNRRRLGRTPLGSLRRLPQLESLWRSAAFAVDDGPLLRASGELALLGCRLPYPPPDWHPPSLDRLQRFHLHYGEEILDAARSGDPRLLDRARQGLESWLAANPPRRSRSGDGWHPYPLSTRVGNWIAAISLEPSLANAAVDDSLRRQLAFLEQNVENGVLGNHLIRNARALALGGAAFGDRRLANRALAVLRRELPEQVLADGGHYERSPVYHLIVLRDLLEIRAALGTDELDATLARMSRFAAGVARPDGAPPLFNDGGLDIAPDLSELLPDPADGVSVFPDTGYVIVRSSDRWLAFDCGAPAPAFLPAHAHADALSFQLWANGRAVVVDPGTCAYEGAGRDWFRSTPAHATIAVDDGSQFAFWGPFRASFLPRVELLDVSGDAGTGHAEAIVTGFPDVRGRIRHRRRLSWRCDGSICVEDEVRGSGHHRISSALPLAPGVSAEAAGTVCEGATAIEMRRPVAERFYRPVSAVAVVAEREIELPHELAWRLAARGV